MWNAFINKIYKLDEQSFWRWGLKIEKYSDEGFIPTAPVFPPREPTYNLSFSTYKFTFNDKENLASNGSFEIKLFDGPGWLSTGLPDFSGEETRKTLLEDNQ